MRLERKLGGGRGKGRSWLGGDVDLGLAWLASQDLRRSTEFSLFPSSKWTMPSARALKKKKRIYIVYLFTYLTTWVLVVA